MSRFVPWAAGGAVLCARRGEPLDQRYLRRVRAGACSSAFDASRSSVTADLQLRPAGRRHPAPLVAGWIVDRFGLRALTVIGMTAAALGHGQRLAGDRSSGISISASASSWASPARRCAGVLSASLLGRWFPAQRLGVALAVAWSASGVGAMVTFPLAQHLIVDRQAGVTPTSSSPSSARRSSRCCSCPAVAAHRTRRAGSCAVCARTGQARPDRRRGGARLAVLGADLLVRPDLDRHLLAGAAGHGLPAGTRPRRRLCRAGARRRGLPDAARHDRLSAGSPIAAAGDAGGDPGLCLLDPGRRRARPGARAGRRSLAVALRAAVRRQPWARAAR